MLRAIFHSTTALLPRSVATLVRKVAWKVYQRSRPDAVKLAPLGYSPRSSFEEAERDAGVGYGDGAILTKGHVGHAWLTEMQDYAAPMLLSVSLAAQVNPGKRIRVLDFGGGRGSFRVYVDDFFEGRILTSWSVVETEEQVRYNDDLNVPFFEFSAAVGSDPYDLAIFSGSLQYIGKWQSILRETIADLIYIARTPLDEVERPYLQTARRGENVCCFAGHVLSKPELFALLSETHELFASWDFEAHLLEMGKFATPAMLWRRKKIVPSTN
jgi:putative methyltransferase (TIGR04325 family)